MRSFKSSRIFYKILLAFFFLFNSADIESKEDTHYSLIVLENWGEQTIYYSYRWDTDGAVQRGSIAPFGSYRHWWKFAHSNQNWAPWFYLHLDGDDRNQWHKLESYFSPGTDEKNGRHYILDGWKDKNGDVKYNLYYDEEEWWLLW